MRLNQEVELSRRALIFSAIAGIASPVLIDIGTAEACFRRRQLYYRYNDSPNSISRPASSGMTDEPYIWPEKKVTHYNFCDVGFVSNNIIDPFFPGNRSVAVHRWAAHYGYARAYWTDMPAGMGDYTITCLKAGEAGYIPVNRSEVLKYGDNPRIQAHRWCFDKGYATGFFTGEQNQSQLGFCWISRKAAKVPVVPEKESGTGAFQVHKWATEKGFASGFWTGEINEQFQVAIACIGK